MEIKTFEQAIRSGDFTLAKELIDLTDFKLLDSKLSMMGFDNDEDISPYLFLIKLILEEESADLHALASVLISSAFVYLPGAYSLGLEHIRKAIKLSPNNLDYKQVILLYHNIPDRLLSKEEAIKYAKQVLEVSPSVKVAQDIIERYKEN